MSHPFAGTLQELFEALNDRIDKPIEYNHILTSIIQQIAAGSGLFTIADGMVFFSDPSRTKDITVNRSNISGNIYSPNVVNRYMRIGKVPMQSDQGWNIPRDAVITGLWAKSRSTGSWSIEVRKNGVPVTLVSVPVVSGIGSNFGLDFDVDKDDWLQLYVSGTDVDYPIASLEIAYRL